MRVSKLNCQCIQQLRMAGQFALSTEIFFRLDQTDAEHARPNPVDRHTGRQRVLLVHQPPRESLPIHGSMFRHRVQRYGHTRLNCRSWIEEVAFDQ